MHRMRRAALLLVIIFGVLTAVASFTQAASRVHADAADGPPSDGNTFQYLTDWEYVWEDPAVLDEEPSGEVLMPGTGWQRADRLLSPQSMGKEGVMWFRARLPVIGDTAPSLQLQASQLFEVYLDGKSVFRHGALPPQDKPVYRGTPPRVIPLPADASGKTVYIRVYSHGKDIGIIGLPTVASRQAILLENIESQSVRFILGCFYMLVGFLALYPYGKLRQIHLFSFAGFAVNFGIYTASRTSLVYIIWDRPFFWMHVELGTLIVSLGSVIAFIGHLFGTGAGQQLRRLWQIHLLFGAVSLPLTAASVLQGDDVLRAYQYLILFSMALGVHRIARQALQGDADAKTILFGMVVFCSFGAVDIFRQMLDVSSALPELAYWGAFVFLITLIIVIIRRLILMLARLSNTEKLSVAGQLAAGVAHEIRNPITVISGYLQLMRRTESNSKILDIMAGEVNRIQLIMNEFLFLAKPAAPKFGSHRMEEIIRDVLQLFQAQAGSSGVGIHFRADTELSAVDCDSNQLKQVLVNIIKNSLEAMPDGGQLTLVGSVLGQDMFVRATDTGCGIPDHELVRIGEPFYTTKENGNGLGVMICRSIMENHKGSFTINSAAGEGTTVTLRLPLRRK